MGRYTFAPKGGINWLHCTVPGVSAQLDTALTTDNTALFGRIGDEAAATGCYKDLIDQNDVFVAQKWLKGLPQGHVVAYPYSVYLAALYPG